MVVDEGTIKVVLVPRFTELDKIMVVTLAIGSDVDAMKVVAVVDNCNADVTEAAPNN